MSGDVVAWVNGKGLACLQEVRSGSLFATSAASELDGQDTALVLATDYAALQAKLDAVTKDAERYRFLRDEEAHRPFGRYPVIVGRFGEELDTAIDAAMQQRTALTDQGRAGEVDRG